MELFARNDEEVSLNSHLEKGMSFRFDLSRVELIRYGNDVVVRPKIRPVRLKVVEITDEADEAEVIDTTDEEDNTPVATPKKKKKGKAKLASKGAKAADGSIKGARSKNKGRPPAKRDAEGNIMRDAQGHPISSGPSGDKKTAKKAVAKAAPTAAPVAPSAPVEAAASTPAPTPTPEVPKAMVTTEAPISTVDAPKP